MESAKVQVITQLISTLADDYKSLEIAFESQDIEKFKMIREEMLKLQKRIDKETKQ
jgi:hypothetical protein